MLKYSSSRRNALALAAAKTRRWLLRGVQCRSIAASVSPATPCCARIRRSMKATSKAMPLPVPPEIDATTKIRGELVRTGRAEALAVLAIASGSWTAAMARLSHGSNERL